MLVFRLLFLCHLDSFTLFLSSSSSSSLLLFSHVFPASSQWLHLSMSLCVFPRLLSARLHERYAGVRGPALPGLWGAADQLFITAKQILASLSRALAGGLKKTERERLKRGSFSIGLSPSHTFSLKWSTHYHMHVLRKRKRVLAFAVFNHRFSLLSFFFFKLMLYSCPFYSDLNGIKNVGKSNIFSCI